jgi:hypothetical protein
MSKIGLGALGMIESTMADGTAGRPHSQLSTIEFSPASVSHFGGFVYELQSALLNQLCWQYLLLNLVECRKYVISKLNFSYGSGTHVGGADPETDNSLFA